MNDRSEWAEQLEEKSLELLEFTLEIKEELGEDSGWEWFYLMNLLADRVAHIVKGETKEVELNDERKGKFNTAYTQFLQAFLGGKQGGLDGLGEEEKEKVRELVATMKVVRKAMPVRRTGNFLDGADTNTKDSEEVDPTIMVGTGFFCDVDVLVALPGGTYEAVRKKVEGHLRDELSRGKSLKVEVGKGPLRLFLRDERDSELVKTAVNEILRPNVYPDDSLIRHQSVG